MSKAAERSKKMKIRNTEVTGDIVRSRFNGVVKRTLIGEYLRETER